MEHFDTNDDVGKRYHQTRLKWNRNNVGEEVLWKWAAFDGSCQFSANASCTLFLVCWCSLRCCNLTLMGAQSRNRIVFIFYIWHFLTWYQLNSQLACTCADAYESCYDWLISQSSHGTYYVENKPWYYLSSHSFSFLASVLLLLLLLSPCLSALDELSPMSNSVLIYPPPLFSTLFYCTPLVILFSKN